MQTFLGVSGAAPLLKLLEAAGGEWIDATDRLAGLDALEGPLLALFLREGVARDFVDQRDGNHHHAFGVTDDHVAGEYQGAAARNRDIRLEWIVDETQN